MTGLKDKIAIAIFIIIALAMVTLFIIGMICFINSDSKTSQYKYIVVGDKQYVIEDLSDLWERRDFIEFTTKDGIRIHATTYELRK